MQHTPDISKYVIFKWYQWAYYWDEIEKEKKLCRWLGVASNVGQSMCYNVLLSSGEYIARSMVIPIPNDDMNAASLKEQMQKFTKKLHGQVGNHNKAVIKGETVSEDDIYYDGLPSLTQQRTTRLHGHGRRNQKKFHWLMKLILGLPDPY